MGSTRVARRAGMRQASEATNRRATATMKTMYVTVSQVDLMTIASSVFATSSQRSVAPSTKS